MPLIGEEVEEVREERGECGWPFELVVVSLSRISCNLSPPLLQEKEFTESNFVYKI